MCDIVNDFNLTQLVLKPTRQQSILDLVFTNRVDVVHKVEVAAGLRGSDHDAVHFATNFHKSRITLQNCWSYNLKRQISRRSMSYSTRYLGTVAS